MKCYTAAEVLQTLLIIISPSQKGAAGPMVLSDLVVEQVLQLLALLHDASPIPRNPRFV